MLQKEISDLQVSTASLFSRDHVCVSIYMCISRLSYAHFSYQAMIGSSRLVHLIDLGFLHPFT